VSVTRTNSLSHRAKNTKYFTISSVVKISSESGHKVEESEEDIKGGEAERMLINRTIGLEPGVV